MDVPNTVKEFKTAFYQMGGALADAKKQNLTAGMRFTEYCNDVLKIDSAAAKTAIQIASVYALDELLGARISDLKARLSTKEPKEPSKDAYFTIKLDPSQKVIFDKSYEKFCKEHELPYDSSRSYFIETRCAEYLAEVSEEKTLDYNDLAD